MDLNIQTVYRLKYAGREELVNVYGYCRWSTIDLYSWTNGYVERYDLIRVGLENSLKRIYKKELLLI